MAFANEHREQHPKKIILNVGATAFGQLEAGTKTMEMRLKKDGSGWFGVVINCSR